MNTKSVISGLMAVCMMASAPAFAQRYDYGNNRNDQVQQRDDHSRYQERAQTERRDDRNERYDHNDRFDRHDRSERDGRYDRGQQYNQSYRAYDGRYDHGQQYNQSYRAYEGRGYDANRYQMRRGGQLPSEYRGSRYVVDDWRGRNLSAPPRGYQWVQANNDYVLAAIATGLIAQVLLNN